MARSAAAAECSLNDAECSLNDAECSLNDAKCSLNDAECSLNDAECSLNDAECSQNYAECPLFSAGSNVQSTILVYQISSVRCLSGHFALEFSHSSLLSSDQSQPLVRNMPHPLTNHSPSLGICRIIRPFTAPH
jgi:Tfp pilus assembly protein PilX